MKRNAFFALFCLAVLFFMSSCSSNKAVASESSGNSDFSASSFVFIVLDSNPTTGYSWNCTFSDANVAEIVSDEYVQNKVAAGTVGAGGKHTFVLRGKKEGKVQVTFLYARSNGQPAEKRVYELTVEKDLSTGLALVSSE